MDRSTSTPDEEPSARPDQDATSGCTHAEPRSPWRATGREAPVFFDPRGRRGVVVRSLGIVGSLAIAGALTLIVIGAVAFVHVAPRLSGGPGPIFAHVAGPRPVPDGLDGAKDKLRVAHRRRDLMAEHSRGDAIADRQQADGKRARA